MDLQKQYKIAAYCRLSREDSRHGKTSMSIENQKEMLIQYTIEKGWKIEQFYIDNGYTGTNFERPEFQRMLQDIDSGNINCVITKDLSRLGRNHLHTGIYAEEYFPSRGIRFIAVNDGIDTDEEYNDIAPFKNILNEYYPKDISRKVRQVKRTSATQGKFMGSHTPYGYEKSSEDKHVLVIDNAVAKNIRFIFNEFVGGNSIRMIADKLNHAGIDSPRFYYYTKTGKINPKENEKNKWGHATVSQILKNPVYIGHMVQGKRQNVSFKSTKRRQIEPENWIYVENTHEPIIEQSVWDEAQSLITSTKRVRKTKTNSVSLFAGIIRCSDCGGALSYTLKDSKNPNSSVYRCSCYNNMGKTACTPHSIKESHLVKFVNADIQAYAKLANTQRELLIQNLLKKLMHEQNIETKELLKQKNKFEVRLEKVLATQKSLYEDKCSGKLPEDTFFSFFNEYRAEKSTLETKIRETQTLLDNVRETTQDVNEWVAKITECLDSKVLDRATVVELVDEIIVGESEVVNGERVQNITIKYKFVGTFTDENKKDAA